MSSSTTSPAARVDPPAPSTASAMSQRVRDRHELLAAVGALDHQRVATARSLEASGSTSTARLLARGADVVPWMLKNSHTWRQMLSTTARTDPGALRTSLPNNRVIVSNGLEMVSVFDRGGTEPVCRQLLAGETLGSYYLSSVPLSMRIVDRRQVILEGPTLDDEFSIMMVSATPVLQAAYRYWRSVLAVAEPCRPAVPDVGPLTPRQQRVAELMSRDYTDEAIAGLLGVSVRTVRYDVAALMAALGVRSRFAAGMRMQHLRGH